MIRVKRVNEVFVMRKVTEIDETKDVVFRLVNMTVLCYNL